MLDRLVDIALEAGVAILDIYAAASAGFRTKGDGSPVTDADAKAEHIIVARLRALYPDIPVVAEEEIAAGAEIAPAARFFLVDPLDGTGEFLRRSGEFTVNIALIEDGAPSCGVVYAPALGAIYAGAHGEGARTASVAADKADSWRPIGARAPASAGLVVLASRSHMSAETQAFINRLKVADFASVGSSLKFCKLAAGEADLYPRLGRTMEWDTAAGDAILRAAGGGVYTLDGKPLPYGKRNQVGDADYANPWFVAAGRFDPFLA